MDVLDGENSREIPAEEKLTNEISLMVTSMFGPIANCIASPFNVVFITPFPKIVKLPSINIVPEVNIMSFLS
jgi:hypothetical protein